MALPPWVCPKCGRVWGGLVSQCLPCNNEVARREHILDVYPQRRRGGVLR